MIQVASLAGHKDYMVALLHLMGEVKSAQAATVLAQFDKKWGHLIPEVHRDREATGAIRWEKRVRWARQGLTVAGLMGSLGYGVWTITDAGEAWLRDHPDGGRDAMAVLVRQALAEEKGPGAVRRRRASKDAPVTTTASVGMTLDKLERIKSVMPASEFQQDWGYLYDQLVASKRARMITEVTGDELGQRAQRIVRKVQAFLTGKSNEAPAQEVICSWIHICYVLELYREAAALLEYLEEQDEPSLSSYARRLAVASRARVGG